MEPFREIAGKVTTEITRALDTIEEQRIAEVIQSILEARNIILCGAGRVGLACKGFAMRLGHLGITAFSIGDSTLPPVGRGDLLIVGSSSGETQTVYDIAAMGKEKGARVVLITANPDSRMEKLADSVIVLRTPTKFGSQEGGNSIQPMATLFEQCLQIVYDIMVLLLMERTHQGLNDLWARHTNLD